MTTKKTKGRLYVVEMRDFDGVWFPSSTGVDIEAFQSLAKANECLAENAREYPKDQWRVRRYDRSSR